MELKLNMKFNNIIIRDENLCLCCAECGGGLLFITAETNKITICEKCDYHKVEKRFKPWHTQ